jgi:hypothetical protein
LIGKNGLLDLFACSLPAFGTMSIIPPMGWGHYVGPAILSAAIVGGWYIADYDRAALPAFHPAVPSWLMRYGVFAAILVGLDQLLAAVGGCMGTLIDDPGGGLICTLFLSGIRPAWPSPALSHYIPIVLLAVAIVAAWYLGVRCAIAQKRARPSRRST